MKVVGGERGLYTRRPSRWPSLAVESSSSKLVGLHSQGQAHAWTREWMEQGEVLMTGSISWSLR